MKKVFSAVLVVALCFSMVACSSDEVFSLLDVTLQTAASIGAAVGNVSPADEAQIQSVVSIGTGLLNVVQTDYAAYKASGAATDLQKLVAAEQAGQANLAAALAAMHVSNAGTVQTVTNWVALVVSATNAIVTAVGAVQASDLQKLEQGIDVAILPDRYEFHSEGVDGGGTAKAQAVTVSLPTPESFQARWLSEVCHGNAACGKKVKVHHIKKPRGPGFWHSLGNAIGEAKFGQ